MTIICRPCITLRNGKRLCAHEVGKKAFCFEVEDNKAKASQGDKTKSETKAQSENK